MLGLIFVALMNFWAIFGLKCEVKEEYSVALEGSEYMYNKCFFFESKPPIKYENYICKNETYKNLFKRTYSTEYFVAMNHKEIYAGNYRYVVREKYPEVYNLMDTFMEPSDTEKMKFKAEVNEKVFSDKYLTDTEKELIKITIEEAKAKAKARDAILKTLLDNGECKLVEFNTP